MNNSGEKLLLTGAHGFIGRNIAPALMRLYDVDTLGVDSRNDIVCDLSSSVPSLPEHYDVIVHAAALAHGRYSEAEYHAVNVRGTEALLAALVHAGMPRSVVYLSSVAVYGLGQGANIDETAPLQPFTAYGRSKLEAEHILLEAAAKYGFSLTILRMPLVVGDDAPGNLGHMREAIVRRRYLSIGRADAQRSVATIQFVRDALPRTIGLSGIYNFCNPEPVTVRDIENMMCRSVGMRRPPSIPYTLAKILSKCGDLLGSHAPIDSPRLEKLTSTLTFDSSAVCNILAHKGK